MLVKKEKYSSHYDVSLNGLRAEGLLVTASVGNQPTGFIPYGEWSGDYSDLEDIRFLWSEHAVPYCGQLQYCHPDVKSAMIHNRWLWIGMPDPMPSETEEQYCQRAAA